jgi:hypothetical protein
MQRVLISLLLSAGLAACGGDTGSSGRFVRVGDEVDFDGDGKPDGIAHDQDGDGIADSVDLDRDGTPDVLLPGAQPPDDGDGASADGVDADGAGGDGQAPPDGADQDGEDEDGDAADGDDDPPLVIDIPLAKVACGASSCDIRDGNVCCESWTTSGFGSESMCIEEPACVRSSIIDEGLYPEYYDPFDANRAVVSRCDGAEDCGAGQICCYVRQGVPIPESLGSFNWVGPGAGRQCMFVEDCIAVAAANGVPTGLVSCNDDDDCAKLDGKSCQPEQNNSASTGKDVMARDGFKVCR